VSEAVPGARQSALILDNPLVSVCSEIGRGHPSYLDSILLALARLQAAPTSGSGRDPASENPGHVARLTVPELCAGTSGLAWRLARLGYRFGAGGGAATWLYNHLRSPDARPSKLQLTLLGSSLRRAFAGYRGICLVDHPLLAQILSPVCRVAHLHCELAAPGLSVAPEAWRTFVPVEATALKLQAAGVRPESIAVTGLVVEPELVDVAGAAYAARMARLASDQPLTIGFFASGAEPRPHSASIIAAATSITRAGHKAVLAWGTGMLKAARIQLALRRQGAIETSLRVIWARGRQAATTAVAGVFPDLDVMVSAAHERTNWSVGLGLPMFALLPNIGPFAGENFEFASQQGTCLPLAGTADAASLGEKLDELRKTGRLAEMARSGWGRHSINGADTIARSLLTAVESAS
jgi:hypothetical protein